MDWSRPVFLRTGYKRSHSVFDSFFFQSNGVMFTIKLPVNPFLLKRLNRFLKKLIQTSSIFPNACGRATWLCSRATQLDIVLCLLPPPKHECYTTVPLCQARWLARLRYSTFIQGGIDPTNSDLHTTHPLSSPKSSAPYQRQ